MATMDSTRLYKARNKLLLSQRRRIETFLAKKEAVEYLGGKCIKCGYSKLYCCLDFHHKDPSLKKYEVAARLKNGLDSNREELNKCELLCKNCHQELHYLLDNPTGDPTNEEKIKRAKHTRTDYSKLNYIRTEETKKRISDSKKGCVSAFKNKHHSNENKIKFSEQHKKKIIRDDGKIYDSILDAAVDINRHPTLIGHVCAGRLKTANGFNYKYLEVQSVPQ
jgi:hypothetical protein